MPRQNLSTMVILLVGLGLSLPSCSGERWDSGSWYRIDSLTTDDKSETGINKHGQLNPYRYVFPEQASLVPRRAFDAAGSSGSLPDPFADGSGGDYVTVDDLAKKLKSLRSTAGVSEEAEPAAAAADYQGLRALAVLQGTSTAYEAALVDANARNRLQIILLQQSDKLTAGHLSRIIGFEDQVELLLGTTATATAAVAGIVSPVSTKNILTAISAIASGTRGQIREQVYNNAFGLAIVDRIASSRRKFREQIDAKQLLPVTAYPADAAISDALTYHNMGSFYEGLIQISREIASGDRSSQRPAIIERPATVVPVPMEVKVNAENVGSVKLNFSRTSAAVYEVEIRGVKIEKLQSALLVKLRADDVQMIYVFQLRGAGDAEMVFKAAPSTSSFDIVIRDDKVEVDHKVVQIIR